MLYNGKLKMVKQKFKINLFDIFTIVIIALVLLIAVFSYNNQPYLGKKNIQVVIKISDDSVINRVLPELDKTKEVFYSGTKFPVKQVSYKTKNDELYIIVSGLGDIKENDSIFNGQRIFLNQKVELRSDYFVQGYVVDYYYE